jgi:hypothetical protein
MDKYNAQFDGLSNCFRGTLHVFYNVKDMKKEEENDHRPCIGSCQT